MELVYSKPERKNFLTFDLRDLACSSIRRVVEELVERSRDVPALLQSSSEQESWHFEAVCRFPDGTLMTEKELWERASDFIELHGSALAYARNVSMPGKDLNGRHVWHDDWHPAGSYAIAPLTFKSTRYFDALIDLAAASDLDHADIYEPWIHLLLRHHGWQQDTKRLLAHRCGPLQSDGLNNLVLAVHDLGFREWLVMERGLESFPDEVGGLVTEERRRGIVADVRAVLFVGNDAAYEAEVPAARARKADMIERFPGKLRYARHRYAKVEWDAIPDARDR